MERGVPVRFAAKRGRVIIRSVGSKMRTIESIIVSLIVVLLEHAAKQAPNYADFLADLLG